MDDGQLRVLIVDDNEDVANVTAELLSFYGFAVQSALSGKAGIAIALNFHPDVVLLDLSMPDTSGAEVANALRSVPQTQRAKVVAYTGYSTGAFYGATLKAAEFDKVILKPAPVDILVDAIYEVTAQQRG